MRDEVCRRRRRGRRVLVGGCDIIVMKKVCSYPAGRSCRSHRRDRTIDSWSLPDTESPPDLRRTGSCPRAVLAEIAAASATSSPSTLSSVSSLSPYQHHQRFNCCYSSTDSTKTPHYYSKIVRSTTVIQYPACITTVLLYHSNIALRYHHSTTFLRYLAVGCTLGG